MNINLHTWFSERELDFCPKHFIKTSTPVTQESKLWVLEKLSGRFYVSTFTHSLFLDSEGIIYFEDPQEAVFYEIAWS